MPSSCGIVGCVTRKGAISGVSILRILANLDNLRQQRAWTVTMFTEQHEPKSWEHV
jgi:hypothetical protein